MFADTTGSGRDDYLDVTPFSGAVSAWLNGCGGSSEGGGTGSGVCGGTPTSISMQIPASEFFQIFKRCNKTNSKIPQALLLLQPLHRLRRLRHHPRRLSCRPRTPAATSQACSSSKYKKKSPITIVGRKAVRLVTSTGFSAGTGTNSTPQQNPTYQVSTTRVISGLSIGRCMSTTSFCRRQITTRLILRRGL
jgi:hypothetical protein